MYFHPCSVNNLSIFFVICLVCLFCHHFLSDISEHVSERVQSPAEAMPRYNCKYTRLAEGLYKYGLHSTWDARHEPLTNGLKFPRNQLPWVATEWTPVRQRRTGPACLTWQQSKHSCEITFQNNIYCIFFRLKLKIVETTITWKGKTVCIELRVTNPTTFGH